MEIVLEDLSAYSRNIRTFAEELTTALSVADPNLQPRRDAGRAQWLCGDTRRRFEQFTLFRHNRDYTPFRRQFRFLFKSSDMAPRHERAGVWFCAECRGD
jgi:hypothetical protein